MTIRLALLLLLLIVLVSLPRFNRNDWFIGDVTGGETLLDNDAGHYVSMVDLYRGDPPLLQPDAPFTYRPLAPWLASFLPLSSLTALNVVNLLALWVGALALAAGIQRQGVGVRGTVALLAVFIVGFPTFYYGAIGYVDPVIIGLLGAGCYCIQRGWSLAVVVLVALGVFVKEAVVLLVPVYVVHEAVQRRPWARTAMIGLAMVVAYVIAGRVARALSLDQTAYHWTPSLDRLLRNVTRPRTWISLVLSLGLPGALAAWVVVDQLRARRWQALWRASPWILGVTGSLGLYAFSLIVAYADGRFVWPATVFALPLLAQYLQDPPRRLPAILRS